MLDYPLHTENCPVVNALSLDVQETNQKLDSSNFAEEELLNSFLATLTLPQVEEAIKSRTKFAEDHNIQTTDELCSAFLFVKMSNWYRNQWVKHRRGRTTPYDILTQQDIEDIALHKPMVFVKKGEEETYKSDPVLYVQKILETLTDRTHRGLVSLLAKYDKGRRCFVRDPYKGDYSQGTDMRTILPDHPCSYAFIRGVQGYCCPASVMSDDAVITDGSPNYARIFDLIKSYKPPSADEKRRNNEVQMASSTSNLNMTNAVAQAIMSVGCDIPPYKDNNQGHSLSVKEDIFKACDELRVLATGDLRSNGVYILKDSSKKQISDHLRQYNNDTRDAIIRSLKVTAPGGSQCLFNRVVMAAGSSYSGDGSFLDISSSDDESAKSPVSKPPPPSFDSGRAKKRFKEWVGDVTEGELNLLEKHFSVDGKLNCKFLLECTRKSLVAQLKLISEVTITSSRISHI